MPKKSNNRPTPAGPKPAPEAITLDKSAVANRIRANLLTEQEFAAMLEVSMHTVESWRKKRRGPRHTRLGGGVYYRMQDIMAWTAANVIAALPLIPSPKEAPDE